MAGLELTITTRYLSGADQGCHDTHVWSQEELQSHDQNPEGCVCQQLQSVVNQLKGGKTRAHFYHLPN